VARADACFIGWQDRPIYRYGVSANKLFDYLMAGRAVVHAIAGCEDPVGASGGGIRVPPYNPPELDRALRALAAMSAAERDAMGERGRRHVIDEYEWSVLGRRYSDLCRRLAARPA
jgi:glycosyltransferase involved in cell wall biosynthesis